MKTTFAILGSVLVLALAFAALEPTRSEARPGGRNTAFVVQLLGTAQSRPLSDDEIAILDADQTMIDEALCYDLDLVDPETGNVIGRATDCLLSIAGVGDGLFIEAATFFHLPEGTLVAGGQTTVKPKTGGSPTVTHITGSIPSPGENSILYGSGRFHDAEGSVRLSGAVNLANATAEITFDCLFVVNLD